MRKKQAVAVVVMLLCITAGCGLLYAQWWESDNNTKVHIWPVQGNVYLLVGAGGNIAASVGGDGVLLVDTGTEAMAADVLAAVTKIQKQKNSVRLPLAYASETRSAMTRNTVDPLKPIRYIINTTFDSEHLGGNAKISVAGDTIAGGNVGGYAPTGAAILAHENVGVRIAKVKPPVPDAALPTYVYNLHQYKLSSFFNGEGVLLINAPRARSDSDTMVYFRGSDVLVTGDVFANDRYPMIDLDAGGSIQGVLDGLNHILDIAIPEFRSEGGTRIIPGHGRMSDIADVAYYRDMVTIIRDRIKDMIAKGMTLEQVKAAEPTMDYDPRFGAKTGRWTTVMFVEAVYKSLKQK